MDGKDNGIWGIPVGIAISLFASYSTNTHLWLDDIGMHYRRGLGKPRLIEWKDLDHYEQTVVWGREAATRYLLLRSRDGTTFWISKDSYDMSKLLDAIRTHAAISEQPFVRQ